MEKLTERKFKSSGPRFTRTLRKKNSDLWDQAVNHRLFKQIMENNIKQQVFINYLVIEYQFIDTAAKALGYTIAKANTFAKRRHLANSLKGITKDQYNYFMSTFKENAVDLEEYKISSQIGEYTNDLHQHFLTTAKEDIYLEILGCMLGAEWLYATWCEKAHDTESSLPEYAESWVHMHSTGSFIEHVKWLRKEIDNSAGKLKPKTKKGIMNNFKTTLRAEIKFHDAPYNLEL